ncbi:MAG: glycine zipper 2TM domain-containing protein [Rhodocyclaceae bacterium]|nr:glycine zipper 2TM domain-containing protein [Rhodocyclaceae bacterium]
MEEKKKLHPVIWVAAVSVTVLSIAGVGAILGLIPHVGGKNAEPVPQPAVAQLAPPAVVPPAPATPASATTAASVPVAVAPAVETKAVEKPAPAKVKKSLKAHKDSAQFAQAPGPDAVAPPPGTPYPTQASPSSAQVVPAAPPPCHECGVIENVRAVSVKGQGSGVGVVAGGLLGGILGHQVGGGSGRDLATVAGAVAGGFAGNEIEKNQRAATQYEVVVRLEDGSLRTFKEQSSPPWTIGQPVRLVNGAIQPR